MSYYKHIPYGDTIPLNNPHAFSVSMPTVTDVINYCEDTKINKENIRSAYPRILTHPYIKEVLDFIQEEHRLYGKQLFLLPNKIAAKRVSALSGLKPETITFNNYIISIFPENDIENITTYYSFMKHCGYMVFSREAEDILSDIKKREIFSEEYYTGNSDKKIKNILSDGYDCSDILITNCGMNAIYAGFEAVKMDAKSKNRELVIQYGWAYSDTLHILNKCTEELKVLEDVSTTDKLELLLKERGFDVAFIYLETVSNPLIQVADIPKVYELSKKYDIPLLLDNTFSTPWSVDIHNYCDLIFESLTKYASGQGDVMAGAIVRPKNSRLDKSIMQDITKYSIPLYKRVKERLALTIGSYKERMLKINKNSKIVFDYLNDCDHVEKLFSVNNVKEKGHWDKITRSSDSSCGVISVVFKGELKDIYDKLDLPKGPSLGSDFPIVMTYTLLAHYKETKTKEGREHLNKIGLSTKLLRFSVGIDDPQLIIDALEKVFN